MSSLGVVLVWDSAGSFLHTLGRPGDGPNEFSPSYNAAVHLAQGDSLYVDERRRITVLAPDLTFIRHIHATAIGFGGTLLVTNGGGFVYSGSAPGVPPGFWFLYSDRDGLHKRSFGAVSGTNYPRDRRIVHGRNGTFWAAPERLSVGSYTLEQWDTGGTLVRSIRRDASWFATPVNNRMTVPPLSLSLHADDAGLLWTATHVRKSGAPEPNPDLPMDLDYTRNHLEVWIDVIDPERGTLLASALIENLGELIDLGLLPMSWVRGGRLTSTVRETDAGHRSVNFAKWSFIIGDILLCNRMNWPH